MSWRVHLDLMVRFYRVYFDEQAWRAGGGEPLETEEQFSLRMGWPLTTEEEGF